MAADDDARTAGRDRSRVGVDAGEVDEGAVVLDGPGLGPEGAHGREVVVGAGAPVGHGHADGGHLGLEVAGADAEQEPPAGQHVEGGGLLGEDERVPLREDDDPGGEQQPLGGGGHEAEVHERVEDRVLRLHRRRRHPWARHHDVLAGPDRVEAELLGEPSDGDRVVRAVGRTRVDAEHAELHGGGPYRRSGRSQPSRGGRVPAQPVTCVGREHDHRRHRSRRGVGGERSPRAARAARRSASASMASAVHAHPPELRPVVVVVVDEQHGTGVGVEVAQPLKPSTCLRLHGVDRDHDVARRRRTNTTGTASTPRAACTVPSTPCRAARRWTQQAVTSSCTA